MAAYILKRLLLIIPTFLGITVVTFFIVKLAPGDPVSLKLAFSEGVKAEVLAHAGKSTEEVIDLPKGFKSALERLPPVVEKGGTWLFKNAIFYGRWLGRLVRLDFGRSSKDNRPVIDRIAEAIPVTLVLNLLSLLIVYGVSIPLGVWSACRQGTRLDLSVMVGLFVFYSLPAFWVGTLLLMFLSSGEYLDWFPLMGISSDYFDALSLFEKGLDLLWHLVLPVFCLSYGGFAFLSRFSRTNFLDIAREDYMRTARAKGLGYRAVVWKHGFRNTLIPLLTLMSTLLPALIGGSVVIEQIFGIPGMGRLGFEAVQSRDRDLILGIAAISAFLTLISILIADLLYAWADPRISYGEER